MAHNIQLTVGKNAQNIFVKVCKHFISKIRNISAPKINPHSQTAPRNDKIIFHEGVAFFGHVDTEITFI